MTDPRVLPRALVVLLCTAGAVVTLAGIREVDTIVGPALLSLILVLAVAPVRSRLHRRGAPGWVLVAVPLTILLVVLLGMVAILSIAIAQMAILIPTYDKQFHQLVVQAQQLAASLGIGTQQINEAINSFYPGKVFTIAQEFLSGLVGAFSSIVLIIVLLLAMCLDAQGFSRILAMGAARRPLLVGALYDFAHRTRRYLLVSTGFGLVCSALDVAALWWLGVPLPLLWGVLALITNYIPNIGFVLGLVPPALLGLLSGGLETMIFVIVAYVLINFVVQTLIQPKYLGDAVGLSTTLTFISLILWTFLLGPLGALLAIPLSLLARTLLIDSDPDGEWAAALVSGDVPRTEQPAAVKDKGGGEEKGRP